MVKIIFFRQELAPASAICNYKDKNIHLPKQKPEGGRVVVVGILYHGALL